jgi:hypothetical protein
MIDDSEGLVTPHEAFCRILAINHPQKPDLGHEVKSIYWFREIANGHPDSIACSKALKFLAAKIEKGKIHAQGMRPQEDRPTPINLGELRIGVLKVWDGTFEIRNEGRLYRNVFLSMADLNRELGAPSTVSAKPWKSHTEEMIRAKIREVYSEEKDAGRRVPNINQTPKLVKEKLNADGYDASGNRIKKIAEEAEFKALRERTGVRAT